MMTKGPRSAGSGGVSLVARSEWRARWRSHAVLAVTAALAVAVVVAALTGAARSENAFHRLRAASSAADILAYPSRTNDTAKLARTLRSIPGVAGTAVDSEVWVRPAGTSHFPDYDLYAIAPRGSRSPTGVNRPVIVSGRGIDPARPDEIVVNQSLARELGVTAGDAITLETMTAHWTDIANTGQAGPPDGPHVRVTIVGIGRTAADFGRWKAIIHLSPAFVERYGGQLNVRTAVQARLVDPARRATVRRALTQVDRHAEFGPSPFADDASTNDALRTVATALRIVAVAAGIAGMTAIALLLVRLAGLVLADRSVLVGLGFTRRRLSAVAMLVLGPWLVAGTAGGVLAGVLASPLTMVSLARGIDPAPGTIVVDVAVLVGVAAAALIAATVVLAAVAFRVAAPPRRRHRGAARGLRLGHPLPGILGVRQALFGDNAGGGRTSRGAILAIAIAIAAAVGALGVSASISRLEHDPTLSGQGTSRVVDSGESTDVYDRALPRLARDHRVAMLAGLHISFGISVARTQDLTTLVYDLRRGDLGASVLQGRIADTADEVAVGPVTLEHLGKHVGETLKLRGRHGTAVFHIVGSMLFPEGDFAYDDGAALTVGGADRLLGNVHDVAEIHQIAFDWRDHVDAAAADRSLSAIGLPVLTNTTALKPAAVKNLGAVEALPRFLAMFFGLLALIVLAHAVTVTVRLRTREFATLRALGLAPRATSLIVVAYAFTVVTIALIIGVALGLMIERRVWQAIADGIHVVVDVVPPWAAIGVLMAVVATGSCIVTVIPAWRTRNARLAQALRAE